MCHLLHSIYLASKSNFYATTVTSLYTISFSFLEWKGQNMKDTKRPTEFAEVLREQMQLNSQDFYDLFNTNKTTVSGKPRLKHELVKIKSYITLASPALLDIKI